MKRSLRMILCLFLVMLFIPLLSLTASAEDSGAVLNFLDFSIVLMEDGSAYITETREVVFSGDNSFTRYRVNNVFTGPRVFSDWEVSIDGTPASQLDEPDDDNRPENTFAVEDGDGQNTVSVYFRQQGSGTRVFQISYLVENAVKLYSDVGDFFWYVIPFLLAVLVLTFNKTIGMGSIVAYAVTLFQKAGLSGTLGNVGDLALKVVNLLMTVVAVVLVDRKGRTWLLKVGTAGLTVGLFAIGTLFLSIEKGWIEATPLSGFLTLGAFLAMQTFYSLGPGVCVWLVLSELMPARIRANGMATALFVNQFTAWGLASTFFPMVNAWGYGPVFFGSAVTGIFYFITVLFIPETKGRSLEEIESLFDSGKSVVRPQEEL